MLYSVLIIPVCYHQLLTIPTFYIVGIGRHCTVHTIDIKDLVYIVRFRLSYPFLPGRQLAVLGNTSVT